MKKRIFVWWKFVKRAENIIYSLVFVCFVSRKYFLSFPLNENVRKQDLSANAYFCVNMKLLHMIARRKDEIFCLIVTITRDYLLVFRLTFRWQYLSEKMKFSVLLQQKQAIDQLFIEGADIFLIMPFKKRDRRIADLFFFCFMVMKAFSL